MTDPTNKQRQSRHRAAAKAGGGGFVSTPIGPEAAQALAAMRASGHTIRSAIEYALQLTARQSAASSLRR